MQTETDAYNIKSLGAPARCVKVTGNMKFDAEQPIPLRQWDTGSTDAVELAGGRLFVAGSTHGGEEEIILQVYAELTSEFRNLRLLIAPRHIGRSAAIKKMTDKMGFKGEFVSYFKKTAKKNISEKTILILDTLGDLKWIFGLAEIVFMGGSLVKRGGHNMVEPAMFGKPIIFGPYMFNFRDMARIFLEKKAALEVADKDGLTGALRRLLLDKSTAEVLGQNAKKLLDRQKGATIKNVEEITHFIGGHRRHES